MNKKELENLIANKVNEVKNLAEQDKIADAKKAKEELQRLQDKYDLIKDLEDQEDVTVKEPKNTKKPQEIDGTKAFADAARRGFPKNSMSEGTNVDGGYTVPEDIQTKIEKYRDSKFSLRSLINVKPVTTYKGQQTFKKRTQQTGFSKVSEGGSIGRKATPQFERRTWEVYKYGGYFPVTSELLADSDANIVETLIEWIGDEARVTDNKLILEKINEKETTKYNTLDDLKKAVNVTLGAAFKETSMILTNDDGLQYLDTLKDSDGNYILRDTKSGEINTWIAIGPLKIPYKVVPNCDLSSRPVYTASDDSSVTEGTVYYTRTGSGTEQSPYVYTAVAEPTGNPSTSSYYVVSKYQIPMITGDLKEYVEMKDRKQLTINNSDVAVVGELNAFEEDLTIWRALVREGLMIKDERSIVNGYFEINA